MHSTGIGISIDEDTLATDKENHIVAHKYKDILATDEDLAKLHNPVISYDKEETFKHFNQVGDILGDILPVKFAGISYYSFVPWDEISMYRGVTNLYTMKFGTRLIQFCFVYLQGFYL